jgi:hypothetical protein
MDPIRLLIYIELPPSVYVYPGARTKDRVPTVVLGVGGCFFFSLLDGIFDLDRLALPFFYILDHQLPCVYSARHVSRRRVCDLGILGWVDIVFFFVCLIIVFS